jgi:acyl transferase domain-containing protein
MGDMGNSKDDTRPLAIIGLSGRFAGDASDPDKLWDMCADGKDAWSPVPSDRFNAEAFHHPDGGRSGSVSQEKIIVRRSAYINRPTFAVASF